MYVFTSAIFFLVFFMVVDPKNIIHINSNIPLNDKARLELIADFGKRI